jgi:hypothetical protein
MVLEELPKELSKRRTRFRAKLLFAFGKGWSALPQPDWLWAAMPQHSKQPNRLMAWLND